MTKKDKETCKEMLNYVYIKMLLSNDYETDTIMKLLTVIRILGGNNDK